MNTMTQQRRQGYPVASGLAIAPSEKGSFLLLSPPTQERLRHSSPEPSNTFENCLDDMLLNGTECKSRVLRNVNGGYGTMPAYLLEAFQKDRRLTFRHYGVNAEVQVDLTQHLVYEDIDVYGVDIWHQYPPRPDTKHFLVVNKGEQATDVQLLTFDYAPTQQNLGNVALRMVDVSTDVV